MGLRGVQSIGGGSMAPSLPKELLALTDSAVPRFPQLALGVPGNVQQPVELFTGLSHALVSCPDGAHERELVIQDLNEPDDTQFLAMPQMRVIATFLPEERVIELLADLFVRGHRGFEHLADQTVTRGVKRPHAVEHALPARPGANGHDRVLPDPEHHGLESKHAPFDWNGEIRDQEPRRFNRNNSRIEVLAERERDKPRGEGQSPSHPLKLSGVATDDVHPAAGRWGPRWPC